MFIYCPDTFIIEAINDKVTDIFGYTESDIIGKKTMLEIRPIGEVGLYLAEFKKARAQKKTYRPHPAIQFNIISKDRRVIPVSIVSRPIELHGKQSQFIIAVPSVGGGK